MLMTILWLFSKTFSNLIGVLEQEAGEDLNWIKQNQMIANPEKFHAVLFRRDQTNTSGENLIIESELIKSEETVKLLGIYLNYVLNFEKHFSEIFRQAAPQCNVLKRFKRFIAFDEKKILV